MAHALAAGLVEYVNITDIVDGMTRSVDLNGPAECDESATSLWTVLLSMRGRDSLSPAPETSGNILRWLFSRWSPGKSAE